MNVLRALAMTFSCYSAIPMPSSCWDDRLRGRIIVLLPAVGVVVGVLWFVVASLPLPGLLRGAFLCALPLVVTGGIHLDGFADTHDALASHGSVETKQRILHDPHIGSFGVLYVVLYLVIYFACASELESWWPLLAAASLSFVVSRAIAGLALLAFPLSPGSSMLKAIEVAPDHRRGMGIALGAIAIVVVVLQVLLAGALGAAMAVAVLLVAVRYRYLVEKQFEGNSGDLAGWCIQSVELAQLVVLVVGQCLLDGTGGFLWFC